MIVLTGAPIPLWLGWLIIYWWVPLGIVLLTIAGLIYWWLTS